MKKIKLLIAAAAALSLTACSYVTYETRITTEDASITEDITIQIDPEDTETEETLTEETAEATSAETTPEETTTEETTEATTEETTEVTETEGVAIDIDGSYTTVEDVSLYLYTYGDLPSNFITKKEAKALGWEGGSLEPYAPGKCIGGDHFGNYEGLLPETKGREYKECDIDTLGAKSRGAKRIIYSNDGLIYYTEDHYESFTLLYGEE